MIASKRIMRIRRGQETTLGSGGISALSGPSTATVRLALEIP